MEYMVILETVHSKEFGGINRVLQTFSYKSDSLFAVVDNVKNVVDRMTAPYTDLVEVDWSVCAIVAEQDTNLVGLDLSGCDAICVGSFEFNTVDLEDDRLGSLTHKVIKRVPIEEVGGVDFSDDVVVRMMEDIVKGNPLNMVYRHVVRELASGTVSFV